MSLSPNPKQHPAIETLLPHRPPVLQVEEVISFVDDTVVVALRVRADSIFVADGMMPAWVGIELMAQAIATYAGLHAQARGEPVRKGFLLGTRDYKATVPAFPVDQHLRISAQPLYHEESGLGAFECLIRDGETVLVAARLNVFEPPDFERFISHRNPQK